LKEVKRIQFACDLILSDGSGVGGNLGCSIKGYTLFSPEKVSRDFYLYTKDDNFKRVFVESNIINTLSGEVIKIRDSDNRKSITEKKEDMNIRKGYKLAGDEVLFLSQQQFQFLTTYAFDHDPADSKTLNEEEESNLDEYDGEELREEVTFTKPPYLKLIGFRSIETFNPIYNSTAPVFVTPDLNDGQGNTSTLGGYENSFKTFSSLYQSCVKLGKYAVVFGCLKKNAKPAVFVLYPTRIQNSSKNDSIDFPQGFLLISLPWLDDVRSLPNYFINDETNKFELGEDLKLTMGMVPYFKKLISQFFLGSYNPQDFPNPSLNYFYKIMKHELLQMELMDLDKSLTKNDITSLKLLELNQHIKDSDERVGLIRDINNRLEQLEQTLPKRLLPETTSGIAKKQKTSYPELDENAVLTAWKNDDWSHFTVPQLKGFQSKYKDQIPSATKKQDIINNIKGYLDLRKK
jgi:ATP-dependent DNA helicase 2 subunit 1